MHRTPTTGFATLVAWLIALAAVPATGLAATQVQLRPAAGKAGTRVALDGSGWPRRAAVRVGARGVRTRALKTSPKGAFRIHMTIPKRRGTVAITARAGRRRVVSRFAVSARAGAANVVEAATTQGARARVSPTRVVPGSALLIAGGGFPRRRGARLALH